MFWKVIQNLAPSHVPGLQSFNPSGQQMTSVSGHLAPISHRPVANSKSLTFAESVIDLVLRFVIGAESRYIGFLPRRGYSLCQVQGFVLCQTDV